MAGEDSWPVESTVDDRMGDDQTPTADETAIRGFLVHCFHRQRPGGVAFYGIGRLETGQTFGLVLRGQQPFFFVRCSDAAEVRRRARPAGLSVEPTDLRTMDGEAVARVSHCRLRPLRAFADALSRDAVRTYEADVGHVRHVLSERRITGSVRLLGLWRSGRKVERVAVDPAMEPSDWEPELAVLALDIETDAATEAVLAVSLVGTGPALCHVTEEVHLVGDLPPGPTQAVATRAPGAGLHGGPVVGCRLPVGGGAQRVASVDHRSPTRELPVTCHASEAALLAAVATRISCLDPDVLTGWNVIDFDLSVLARRFAAHELAFNLGRTRDPSWLREGQGWGQSREVVYGRQVVDALHLARVHLRGMGDYRLDAVARRVLGRAKTLPDTGGSDRPEEIRRLYREDPLALCQYCLEDSRLVRDILGKEKLIQLTLRRSLLTGLPLERAHGSVAAFEHLYLGELRRRGYVAPTCGVDRAGECGSPGGLVMAPATGLHRHVFVFDFKSLYPSVIRTFNIDPLSHTRGRCAVAPKDGALGEDATAETRAEGLIRAPNGAVFHRDPGILPSMLQGFFALREQAKAEGNEIASYAYKITMNSFYGVLGSSACRFADADLASAITGFGQAILRWSRRLLEEHGHRVLYGDTDSLFVDIGLADDTPASQAWRQGSSLCDWVNEQLTAYVAEEFGLPSVLELQLEKYYRRFLLPSLRGDRARGRAKGYAGLRVDASGEESLDIVGMEAVRSDWTDLAHGVQRDCLALLFGDCSVAEVARCVRDWVDSVRAGEQDDLLVYRKRLRKPVSAYTRTTPPHVKAAKQLPDPGGLIRYVMTVAGPQPVGHVTSPLDCAHYVVRQIRPIVETIGQVCGLDVRACVSDERSLFGDQWEGGPAG